MTQKDKFSGYYVALGCFIISFILLGLQNSISVFIAAIVVDTGWLVSLIAIMVTFACVSAFTFGNFAGWFVKKLGIQATIILGGFLQGCCYVIFSQAQVVYLLWVGAVLGGATLAFSTYAVCSMAITNWFIDKRTTVIGIVFGGVAFGSTVFTPVCGRMLASWGWRTSCFYLGIGVFLVTVLATLVLIKPSPEKYGQKPLGYSKEIRGEEPETLADGLEVSAARRNVIFYILLLGTFFSSFIINGMQIYGASFLQIDKAVEAVRSSDYLAIFSFASAIGTLASGWIVSRIGTKTFILSETLIMIAGMLVLMMSSGASSAMMILSMTLIGLGNPIVAAVPTFTAMDAFGKKPYQFLVGSFVATVSLSTAVFSPIVGAMYDNTGTYMGGFTMMIICVAISAVLLIFGLKYAPYKKNS